MRPSVPESSGPLPPPLYTSGRLPMGLAKLLLSPDIGKYGFSPEEIVAVSCINLGFDGDERVWLELLEGLRRSKGLNNG